MKQLKLVTTLMFGKHSMIQKKHIYWRKESEIRNEQYFVDETNNKSFTIHNFH